MTLTESTSTSTPTSTSTSTSTRSDPTTERLAPIEIAPETFVIHDTYSPPGAPGAVHMNSMLIRGAEPIVVDTGTPLNRARYLDDLFGLVDPGDVRWVFLSHDDIDHYGNVHEVMDACPNATLVASWFLCDRIGVDRLDVPPMRWRWLNDGETLDVGDRTVAAIRPPLYDSPTTRGLFDPKTGVYWASDCYASPVLGPTAFVDELDPDAWAEGFQTFQAWNSPWVSMVDPQRFHEACAVIERLAPTTIASCHGPTVGPSQIDRACEMLRRVPTTPVPPQPNQLVLDEIVTAIQSMAAGLES
ncbi:MBL fold metallo-hydrolase [Ilumatobacter sp.]|uniref:MBL fold metallo-hydrolase n=1 Tax=Ilumatobacter sp. TaxID=1967498 RepID=UPI003C5B56BD